MWRLSASALLLVLAGCFRLSRESPRVQYFVLGAAVPPSPVADSATGGAGGAVPVPNAPGLAVGLRRLDLASYLATPAIVVRRGVNEIVVSDFHRWGEELGPAINRVMALQLASSAPVRAVDVAPWPVGARHDFLVQLHVSRFEGSVDSAAAAGRSYVVAGWDIVRPLDGRVLVRGRTEALGGSWRVGDYAGLVAGFDAALVRVARDVGACLARFPNDSTPPASCGSEAEAPR